MLDITSHDSRRSTSADTPLPMTALVANDSCFLVGLLAILSRSLLKNIRVAPAAAFPIAVR